MAACIFLFGIFYIAVLNLDGVLQKTEEEVYVAVFFEDTVSPERVEEIGGLIRERPEVVKTVYTSADDAWEGFRNDYFKDGELLDGIFDGITRWRRPITIRFISEGSNSRRALWSM